MTFSTRLRKARLNRKLTQEQLGKMVNVTKVSISGYENGNRTPDLETLQNIANVLDISLDWLLCRSEVQSVKESGAEYGIPGEDLSEDEKEYLKQSLEDFRKLKAKILAERDKKE